MNKSILVVCLLIVIFVFSGCGGSTPTPTPTTTPDTIRIDYIIHDANCALKFSKGTITDFGFKYIENPWSNTSKVPTFKPTQKASCGCFKREYPRT